MKKIIYAKLVAIALLGILLTGCTTTSEVDPLEPFNRAMFTLNKDLDGMILKPASETYKAITPEPVDKGISNFFSNLNDVTVVVNDLLQLKLKQAASDAGRVLVNSTFGLLGVVDVASEWGLPKHYEDFGQTLGRWGMKDGPYLVLPLLGPSTLRDTVGRGVDTFTEPTYYLIEDVETRNVIGGVGIIDMRGDLLEAEKIFNAAALDEYTYLRDAYLKRREYLIYDGNPPQEEVDEDFLFGDDEE